MNRIWINFHQIYFIAGINGISNGTKNGNKSLDSTDDPTFDSVVVPQSQNGEDCSTTNSCSSSSSKDPVVTNTKDPDCNKENLLVHQNADPKDNNENANR